MKCWGNNSSGQVGDGTIVKKLIPVTVGGLYIGTDGYPKISAGKNSNCFRSSDDSVSCWGANSSGQLGNSTRQKSLEPWWVDGLFPYPGSNRDLAPVRWLAYLLL